MRSTRHKHEGIVLLAVLVVVMLTAMIITGMVYQVRAEQSASFAAVQGEQAWLAAMCGLEHALLIAEESPADPRRWYDNESLFAHQLVADDGVERWYFTIFAPRHDTPGEWRYGLTAESGKLDLRTLNQDTLRSLPEMDSALADRLLMFLAGASTQTMESELEGDANPQTGIDVEAGEEGEVEGQGDGSSVPVEMRHLATLDELLLVPGFDASRVYGREHFITRQILRASSSPGHGQDELSGFAAPGLRELLTVYTYDPDLTNAGEKRIDLNGSEAALADSSLPEQTLEYIKLMQRTREMIRTQGSSLRQRSNQDAGLALYLAAVQNTPRHITHPGQLLEANYPSGWSEGAVTYMSSGIDAGALPALLDGFTSQRSQDKQFSLVNVNTAEAVVLRTIPGIDGPLADAIVSTRQELHAEALATTAWLYTEQLVDAERFRQIAPYITAQAYQFHLYVVGYGLPSGRYRLIELVLDVGRESPRIIYIRDLTRLSLPLDIGGFASSVSDVARQQ